MNDLHRLLRRQIKDHFGDIASVPENIKQFLGSVNQAYKDLNQDLTHAEHILKESSLELFKANKELIEINARNEKIIEEKTEGLRKTTFNLQSAEKLAGLGSFIWDIEKQTVEISEQLSVMLNIDKHQTFIGIDTLLSKFKNEELIRIEIEKTLQEKGKIQLNNVSIKDKDNYFLLEGEMLEGSIQNGNNSAFLGVLLDITENKNRENEINQLLESLQTYKNAIDQSAIVSITDASGVINYVNDKFCEVSQFSEKELIGAKHNIVNSGHHPKEYFKEMWQTISSGKIWKGIIKNKRKDTTNYWVDSTIVPFSRNGKIYQYISIRFDITEKMNTAQKVEEQRTFYETILNNIPVDIAVFNHLHQYLFVNPIAVKNPDTRQFLIGKDDFDYCVHFGKDNTMAIKRREMFEEVKNTAIPLEFTDKQTSREGNITHTLRRFFPVFKNKHELEYMIGFGIDITERILASQKLEESLEEKEALLGEVHHRVKNNLALVMGLIEMQGVRTENEFLKSQFSEIQHRISAMSLIHEKLYKSTNFSKIDLRDYLQDFVKFLAGFYGKGKDVKLHFDLDEYAASTKVAIPLALIVNELVTNSYKYAFNDNLDGNIYISLKNNNDEITLSVADNGPGAPEGTDVTKNNSLGMKLLIIFTKQLKGSYEIFNDNGFRVNVKFKQLQEKNFNS